MKLSESFFPFFREILNKAIQSQDVLTPYFLSHSNGDSIFPKELPEGPMEVAYSLETTIPVVNFSVVFVAAQVIFEISIDIGWYSKFSEDQVNSLFEPPCGPWVVSGLGVKSLKVFDWDGEW